MRIERARQAGVPGSAGATGPRGSGFTVESGRSEAAPGLARSAGPIGLEGIEALLALQVADDPRSRRRRAVARGRDMLDVLDDLRIGLLSGRLSPEKLDRLAALVAADPGAADNEGLRRVLDAIELRARVELAKLGRTIA